ncbi:hypothetical protein E2C01_002634 [Portunus trituberculatus]|uniref:Uncharacterized protein n=1 Tax=Portunus trituberculatus TaxID=210409 RepID=A0A5B7CKF8_PORTR|nr:hypothetical protein [Portunus trituberculatus]
MKGALSPTFVFYVPQVRTKLNVVQVSLKPLVHLPVTVTLHPKPERWVTPLNSPVTKCRRPRSSPLLPDPFGGKGECEGECYEYQGSMWQPPSPH